MSGLVLLGLRILAAVALYAFLGGVLYLLWRSLSQDALTLASRRVIPLDLYINAPGEEDRLVHFTQSNVAIGRDSDCDCILLNPTVSARHARLAFHHSQWWVDDLLSTNGTLLNDEPLQTPTVVVNGDIVKCGQIALTIIFTNDTFLGEGELK